MIVVMGDTRAVNLKEGYWLGDEELSLLREPPPILFIKPCSNLSFQLFFR
jgi:hypothetical protein